MTHPTPLAERLHRRLAPADNGCIVWTGSTAGHGYGRISRGPRGAGWAVTHRVSWELANGPIPAGLFVLHRCDNPPCCNPDHLFLGTLKDNTQDMLAKGRHLVERGENHHDAKLMDADVAHLRALAPSVGNYAALGRMFGISKQHARSLALGHKRSA